MLLSFALPGPGVSDRFGAIIGLLRQAVARHGWRNPDQVAFAMFLGNFLGRVLRRFERIAAQPRTAPLLKPNTTPEEETPPPPARSKRPPPAIRLSRERGWLGQWGHEVRAFASQLGALLADPEMAALLASDPRMARLLRPLCHMLGVENLPEILEPRRRKRAPRPRKVPDPEDRRWPRPCGPRGPSRAVMRWIHGPRKHEPYRP